MQFSLKMTLPCGPRLPRLAIGALGVSLLASTGAAYAESAYIEQAAAGAAPKAQTFGTVANNAQASFIPTPESVAPARRGSNVSQSLTIGNSNTIAQIQAGRSDLSAVSVIGGNRNNVGVVQAGGDLKSNVALLGTQGLNIAVLQPMNSAPVNMLIARLPNGGLLIKR